MTVIFDRWRRWSDETRAALTARDVAYGTSPHESLDLAVPHDGAPLVVFFHGGYWRRLDKDDFTFVAPAFARHGIATAIVNYALAPSVTLETIVGQTNRAVRWLRAHGGTYGYDSKRIVVAGHSAGGHLAAMAAVDAPVRGVVTISGLHDLREVARSFANEWLALDDARAAALSPVLLRPAAPVVVLSVTGEHETDAFRAQGRAIVDAWKRYGCDARYEDSPGDDHFTVVSRLRDPADALTRATAAVALS